MNRNYAHLLVARSPTEGWPLLVVLALFLIFGTFQHDPWKNEDAAHFGVVWRALQSGDWLYLRFSSGTQAETPLYYWFAGVCASLLQGLVGAANAARLASTLMVALSLVALNSAARNFYGRELAAAAPLTLIGCLGFLVASHDTQPLTAMVAGLSLVLYGISLLAKPADLVADAARPELRLLLKALAYVALGLVFVLLASGIRLLPALIVAGFAFAAHPARRQLALIGTFSLAIAALLLGLWFLFLREQHPQAAAGWLKTQLNLFRPGGGEAMRSQILVTAVWFTWPAWPIAALVVWKKRAQLLQFPLLLPVALTAAILFFLVLTDERRQAWLCALLPGLALLASPGVKAMQRGVQSLLDWFGRMTFIVVLIVLWAGWSAMIFGWPAGWAKKSAAWAPGFVGGIEGLSLAIALVATIAWLWICFTSPRSPLKGLFSWSGGMVLFWLITTSLWLPWIEHQRSYRSIAAGVTPFLSSGVHCISTNSMGEGQFAAIDYHLVAPLKRETRPSCSLLLRQERREEVAPLAPWIRVWEGQRPGDKVERYRLYSR